MLLDCLCHNGNSVELNHGCFWAQAMYQYPDGFAHQGVVINNKNTHEHGNKH